MTAKAARIAGTLILLTLLCAAPFVYDTWQDRKHTLQALTDVTVIKGVSVVQVKSGSTLKVKRIRYTKDDIRVDVFLPNGQSGTVNSGKFKFEPPLE